MSGSSASDVKRAPSERSVSNDLHAKEHSRTILWRSDTSFSDDGDEDDNSNAERPASVLVIKPSSAQGEAMRLRNPQMFLDQLLPVAQQTSYTVEKLSEEDITVQVNLDKYMASREMSPTQERMNALTMLPQPIFCLCFVLSGSWVSKHLLNDAIQALQEENMSDDALLAEFENNPACVDWSNTTGIGWLFQHIHAVPPLAVLAVLLGVVLSTPFSFLYHWKYAHALSSPERTVHWSRRMDQSMIHVSSALTSLGTSASWNFFLVNAMFNADCIYRQFQPTVRPRHNQVRLGVAIFAWTLPILKRGDMDMFFQIFTTLTIGICLFVFYPIGGWSHTGFHFFLMPLMPMLMEVATNLSASQEPIQGAAHCFALAQLRPTYS